LERLQANYRSTSTIDKLIKFGDYLAKPTPSSELELPMTGLSRLDPQQAQITQKAEHNFQ
jgi:hypothetical protein